MPQAITLAAFSLRKRDSCATLFQSNNYKEERKMAENTQDKVVFRQLAHIGILDKYQTGWTKEVNIISWNNGPAKLDIREWDPSHERMTRGITLTAEQAARLAESIQARDAVGLLQDFAKSARTNDVER